jgi:hypothetical protein
MKRFAYSLENMWRSSTAFLYIFNPFKGTFLSLDKQMIIIGAIIMAEERKQISFGQLVSKADFGKTPFVPVDVKKTLKPSDYYLFIFIPGEDIIKLSIFPCKTPSIKKILIRLKEFSPDLVKGISDVLKNFNLGDSTIHTTGLCFSGINCFYETYIDADAIKNRKVSLDTIKADFLKVPRVEKVELVDVVVAKL